MRKLFFALALAAPALALAAGCADTPAPTSTPGDSAPAPAPAPVPSGAKPKAVAPIPVAVIDGNFEKLDATVAEQKGNVVLVDFWATWCVPCVKKFPHLVEAHKKYREKGLACISASLDPKPKGDYDKDAVLKFLQEKGATFPNVVLVGYRQETEKLGRRFGYEGGLPLLVLFDKTGKKVWDSEMWSDKEWPEEKFYAELDKLIEAELAK